MAAPLGHTVTMEGSHVQGEPTTTDHACRCVPETEGLQRQLNELTAEVARLRRHVEIDPPTTSSTVDVTTVPVTADAPTTTTATEASMLHRRQLLRRAGAVAAG